MDLTILHDGEMWTGPVVADGDDVRLSGDALEQALGFRIEPEGLCRGAVCIPTAAHQGLVAAQGVGLAELASVLGQPLAWDRDAGVASLGESPDDQRARLESLAAPDFELTDLEGKRRRLTEFRGKKVLLHAFASW
ncbi:MAG: hypothetical protein P8R42_05725 [Candidatus Binatia bacterium]|nr:hypothetical protein [Candidatus Binatia bacterium]